MTASWIPTAETVARAQVTRLAQELGCEDFAALRRFSVEHPDAYWRHANGFLRIAWSREPDGYVDLPDGPAFPNWFPGGELNWVDTVLGWGRDPARRAAPAVIAEREDGGVRAVTWAEMEMRVLGFAAGLRALGLGRGDRVGLDLGGRSQPPDQIDEAVVHHPHQPRPHRQLGRDAIDVGDQPLEHVLHQVAGVEL